VCQLLGASRRNAEQPQGKFNVVIGLSRARLAKLRDECAKEAGGERVDAPLHAIGCDQLLGG
jgi:hypothetical protein